MRYAPVALFVVGCAGQPKSSTSPASMPQDTGTSTPPDTEDTATPTEDTAPEATSCDTETPLPRRLRRLSHREYAHTLDDLFGVDIDPRADLAADPTVDGFDNDAETLRVSSLLADQYRSLSETVALEADLSPWLSCDLDTDGLACAEAVLPGLARSVWRRPLTEAEHATLTTLLSTLAAGEGAETGLRWTLATLLQSPHFLYRSELGVASSDGTYTLSSWERATALSYHLLGTTPDESLLDTAASGRLDDATGMTQAVDQLSEDPRFANQIADLSETWLHLHHLDSVSRVDLTDADREHMLDAVHTRIRDAVTSGASVDDLFDDGGLLLEPAVLTAHGVPDGSGPVQRGVMVRELLLCEDLPPPPSGVDTSAPDVDPTKSTRERFSQHSEDPLCASCHTLIDPLGFAFEHYDQLGRWRETDNGHTIDATGDLDGVPFEGAVGLAGALVDDPRLATCFVQTARRWVAGTHICADSVDDVGVAEPLISWVSRPAFVERLAE